MLPLVLPKPVRIALVAAAVALQVLNQAVFGLSPQWHAFILIAAVFLAGIGVHPAPVAKSLHLPVWAVTLITAGVSAGTLAVTFIPIANVWHVILTGVLTFMAGIGYGAGEGFGFQRGGVVPGPGRPGRVG